MKLNHLILVICTGILVGFSACKKDPFTEADAIAAQKELITMKYGYELQLKNIEAAISKANNDAAIAMKNLEIKGASDLQKQKAADDLAYLLAELNAELNNYKAVQKFDDSLAQAIQARVAAAEQAAALQAAYDQYSTVYTRAIRILDGGIAVEGAKVKIFKFDGSGYFEATSNKEGYVYVTGERFMKNAQVSVIAKNTDTKVYPIIYTTPSVFFGGVVSFVPGDNTTYQSSTTTTISNLPDTSGNVVYNSTTSYYTTSIVPPTPSSSTVDYSFSIVSYNPSNIKSVSGTVWAATNLTNNAREGVGGVLISASVVIGVNGTLPSDTTATRFSFATTSLSSGSYSFSAPALSGYTLTIPKSLTTYQRAYTLVGENPYQALPTRSDSIPVVLAPSGNLKSNYTWADAFYASYFMTLPDSDADGGYSATLTDPKGFLPYLLSEMDLGGNNLPTGFSGPDSSLPAGTWKIDAGGFLLNNGHLSADLTNDANIMYELPVTVTLDSSKYKWYMSKPIDSANPNNGALYTAPVDSAKSRTAWRAAYLTDQINNVAAATLLLEYGTSTPGVWTPTIATSESFANDTLSVGLVDLTGRFLNEEPEFLAVVDASTEVDGLGQVTEIILLADGDHGLFNITAVLNNAGTGVDNNWFTNYGGRLSGQVSISGTVGNDYTRSNFTIGNSNTGINWNYGALAADTYFNAVGVAVDGNNFGEQNIGGSRNSYIITFPTP